MRKQQFRDHENFVVNFINILRKAFEIENWNKEFSTRKGVMFLQDLNMILRTLR